MKGINHLVLASHDLEALRSAYQALGFAVKQRGGLPFGISNSVVQLQGNYLELLSVTGDVRFRRTEAFELNWPGRLHDSGVVANVARSLWPGPINVIRSGRRSLSRRRRPDARGMAVGANRCNFRFSRLPSD